MCTELLPPGVNQIAVNISYIMIPFLLDDLSISKRVLHTLLLPDLFVTYFTLIGRNIFCEIFYCYNHVYEDSSIPKCKDMCFFHFFTAVPCISILSKSFIYQLMPKRDALREYEIYVITVLHISTVLTKSFEICDA